MNFLAGMGVSMTTVSVLRQLGHNVVHLREQGLIRWKIPVSSGKCEAKDGSF
jgi:hypothetical protein